MSAYAEFAVTTNFSFLRGGSHPEEYVVQANHLGLAAIGIADRNTLAGAVRAYGAAQEHGGHVAVGCRLVFVDGTPDILAYPRDRAAYGRLCRLLSHGNLREEAVKGQCWLTLPDLLDWVEGLCLILIPPRRIGSSFETLAQTLTEAAPRHLWLGASMLYRGDDSRRLSRLRDIGHRHKIPLIAIGDVIYHHPDRRPLQDIVTCIRDHVTLEQAGRRLEANAERHLKYPQEMGRLFRAFPEAVAETISFLSRLDFSMDQLKYDYPLETREGFATPQDALIAFTWEGAARRYRDGIPESVRQSIEDELSIIADLNYAPYFLTVYDIVREAKRREILCQGRGSAANSAVCFCLGITEVDPATSKLLFARFISESRNEPPDIDVDFEHERRPEILEYVYSKYGRARAGLAATTITYRTRSALREVGKVFGLSEDTTAALAGTVWGWSAEGVAEERVRELGLDPSDWRLAQVLRLARELIGFPRHLSQHVGGMVITHSRLDELVPVTRSAMEDRPIVEWNKDDLDTLKLLKVDILALGMLTAIKKCFTLLNEHYGRSFSKISEPDGDDERVYAMLQRADSIGVFQVESRAQQSMLPRLKPDKFEDLVIEVAIVRPGPIQGGMVHPYLQRKQSGEQPVYPSKELEEVLKPTLGVPLFQEQAMQIAMVAADFTATEADQLRRAMATFRNVGTIGRFHDKLVNRMKEKNYDPVFIDSLWKQIEGFGSYGFPRSHAESFALIVYCSAWIKCHYPDVFAVGLLNSWPMGFYAPAQLIRDAQEHGIEIRPVDILTSSWDHDLEVSEAPIMLHPRHGDMKGDILSSHAVRLGLRQVHGLSWDEGQKIVELRGEGYDSLRDLWLRTGLSPATLEKLADADAFRSLGLDRRAALWAIRGLNRAGDKDDLPLFRAAKGREIEPDVNLPPMRLGEQVIEDYRHLKLSLKAHPVSFVRSELHRRKITPCEMLPHLANGRRMAIAGLVLVRQRPGTSKGVIFMTIEDEGAWANVIVWPKIFEEFRPMVLGSRLVGVTGRLQSASGVIHLIAERLEDLSPLLDTVVAGAATLDSRMPPDESKRPVYSREKRPGHSNTPDLSPPAPRQITARQAMPKGRNFH
ncbi:error-prone DNA polymerase [Rhodoligotrophos appendicifer]|uniref:error-prone DNA polymerase n=1 Tax=Rhodoligotrophos appendicifer TaxID=987056 RepID=UPI0011862B93|nr:error-prone DNA polymerase [Rhodoligotrophos appendicifer]